MSTLDTYTLGTRPAASGNTGLCIFSTDNNAIEVSDGTNWQTYNSDGSSAVFTSNSYSVDFDGTNDYIDITGASGLFNNATAFSISLWYYADAYGGAVFGSGDNITTNRISILPYSSGNNFYFAVRNGSVTQIVTTSPALNQWVHVAATYNAGNGTLYLTPSGGSTSITSTSSFPTSLSSSAGTDLSVGRDPAPSFYFNGKVDEVAIWNREITSTEVSNIINNKEYVGVSAMWRLENTADATIGGSGYNGTMNNFVSPQGFVSGAGNTPY